MWLVLVFSFTLIYVSTVPQINGDGLEYLELPEAQHNISSILCIIKFCEKYFRSEKAVIGSLVIVNVQNTTEFHSELIFMLNEHANYELGVMTKDATKPHGNPLHVVDKAKNYFVVFNRTSEVNDAINQWNRLPTWNPLAQVVALFVNTYEDEELLSQMKSIFQLFLNRHMIDINIISYRYNSNIVQAHTFYPYDEDNCATDVVELHLIEECEYSDESAFDPIITINDELRPKIPNNLHGCEMHIASSVHEPFVFHEQGRDTFDMGLEVLMIKTVAQSLRMTPVFNLINGTRENRQVSNETGIYSTLLTQKNDILIGGLDNDARVQKILWISIPYIQDDQTWCVATARPQDLWQNIFSIYTVSTWLSLIGAIFFNAFVIYLMIRVENRHESYVWTLMIGMASALGQYATYEPKRISIRVMMIFLFMYGIVMSSSFNSFLIGILTRPRYKLQVSNLDLAIEYNFKFTGGEVALSHYLGNDSASSFVRKNFEICINIDECLKRLEYDETFAVAVSRLHAQNTPALSRSQMYCFPRTKNIYSYSVAMPIKLDYHLLPAINYNIRQLFEFGLVERWNKLSQSIALNLETERILHRAASGEDNRLVVLTVAHIMGAILIMFFGHFIALITFLIEMTVNRKIQKRNCAQVWILFHWFLRSK